MTQTAAATAQALLEQILGTGQDLVKKAKTADTAELTAKGKKMYQQGEDALAEKLGMGDDAESRKKLRIGTAAAAGALALLLGNRSNRKLAALGGLGHHFEQVGQVEVQYFTHHLEPVDVKVVQRERAVVAIRKGKGGAGDAIIDAEAAPKPLGEARFAGSQVSGEYQHVAIGQATGERSRQLLGLFRSGGAKP